MTAELEEKYEKLKNILRDYGSAAVAFSSGVDSTFLLRTAHDVLGEKCIAVTACSVSFPEREKNEAEEFCKKEKIAQYEIYTDELKIEGFSHNPVNRCYICKHALFTEIIKTAYKNGIETVVEGSNMDDNGDYRPGLKAVAELEIKSPLREAELYKQDIRSISKEIGLATWKKPSFACLASRFVYGEEITYKKLEMVDKAEQVMIDMGFSNIRVRIHGNSLARIEVGSNELMEVLNKREIIIKSFRIIGFTYVTMDLEGYRTGSMNETIKTEVPDE